MTYIPTIKGVVRDYAPGYGPESGARESIAMDPAYALQTRSTVLTDEGSFRANFANSSLWVSIGSVTVLGATVTGTGFAAADVHINDYFLVDADAATAAVQIKSVDSDTQITLVSAYGGTTSGAASRAHVLGTAGSGATITVASGQCTIAAGTTATAVTRLRRNLDYAPFIVRERLSISQRIANQSIYIGGGEDVAAPRWFARFNADGTTNTTIKCETGRNPTGAPSASETESTTITIPNGLTTATLLDYRIEVLHEVVRFFIEGILVASHNRVIPLHHDEYTVGVSVENGTTPASGTSVVVDYIVGKNHNKVEVGIMSEVDAVVASQPPYEPRTYSVAGVITINTDLIVIDCSRYRSISVQCTSMGTTGVVTPAWSNDGTTWVTATMWSEAGASSTTFNAAVLRNTNVYARYFRLRLTTATTAGTTTIYVNASQIPVATWLATQPISGTVTSSSAAGPAAHDAAISGNPVRQGARALTASYTAVASGDVADLISTLQGVQIVKLDSIPENTWNYAAAGSGIVNTTTAVTIKAAAAAGIRNYIKSLQVDHDALGGVTELVVRDGASGTVLWRGKLQTTAAEGAQVLFDPPLRGTAATLMEVATLTAVTGGVYVNAQGYIAT